MKKYIFVTGGVVSGLGKGITSASIGLILKSNGINVDAVKLDPYLNVDPGTMSPFEHGEVFVLEDGSETDLDLGHYERYLDTNLTKNSSISSGKIYSEILQTEREGEYLGKNVQLIPHVTNLIQEKFSAGLEEGTVRLIEIGGSTGDMEGEVYLEALRQFKLKNKEDVLHIHLGYVPYLRNSGEYKSKPFQNSIRDLLKMGLQPDILVARYSEENGQVPDTSIFNKIALFGNINEDNVVSLPDVKSIYLVPSVLSRSNMIKNLSNFVDKDLSNDLPLFYREMDEGVQFTDTIKIGIVAKYSRLDDAYISIIESLKLTGVYTHIRVQVELIDAELLEEEDHKEWKKLKACDGIIVAGGFGSRGLEGKIKAIESARTSKTPFLGICLGLQMAVVEYGRNVANILDAHSSEMYDEEAEFTASQNTLIDYMSGQSAIHKKGGTMRLGGYSCDLVSGSLAKEVFAQDSIIERHRHRLEVKESNIVPLLEKGLIVSGYHNYKGNDGTGKRLVEIIELDPKDHPYFIAIQSHPELVSRPDKPHPLFVGLVKASGAK